MRFEPGRDGMAWLTACAPAELALAAYHRVTEIAVGLKSAEEPRSLSQLRADVLCDRLIDGTTTGRGFVLDAVAAEEGVEPDDVEVLRCLQGQLLEHDGILRSLAELDAATKNEDSLSGPVRHDPADFQPTPRQRVPRLGHGVRAEVLVDVPVLALLGHDDEPATLEGYGPIDPDTARRLAAHAPSLTTILTHPQTGAVLSVGRDSYVVPADLRTWLRVRNGTCRFPDAR